MTSVTVTQPKLIAAVGENAIGVTPVAGPVVTLELGIRGPAGQGAAVYEHTQSVASAAWILNHNLGYRPGSVTVFSPGGQEVEVGVTHNSLNQLTIEFAAPYVGTARVV